MNYFLYPLGLLYGSILKVRRYFYQQKWLKSYSFPVSTIGVGNLRVGGTGKTPHIEFLIREFANDYTLLATLSRGYGRLSKGYLLASTLPQSQRTARNLGDEPLQFFTKFPFIEVAVCEDRKAGIENILRDRPQVDMILLDDVFQHLSVQPDCQILLTEYADPYYADFPLPAGRLREFAAAATAADIIIVTKTPKTITQEQREEIIHAIKPNVNQQVFFSTYIYEKPKPCNPLAEQVNLLPDTPIILLTGIAKSQALKREVETHFHNVKHYPFPDHYTFPVKKIQAIIDENKDLLENGAVLLTTEKDTMRLITNEIKKVVSLHPLFSLPIRVEILFNEKQSLIKNINSYVTKN